MKIERLIARASIELSHIAPVLLVLLVLGLAAEAIARPGGGHGYSGGSRPRSGGGGRGGGDGDGIGILIWLLFEHPMIGIPVTIVVIILWANGVRQKKRRADWSTTVPTTTSASVVPRRTIDRVRTIDPDFSLISFEDFLYTLYARAQEARAKNRLDPVSAYLSAGARQTLVERSTELSAIHSVVIGAMSYSRAQIHTDRTEVGVRFEANYTEVDRASKEKSWWVREEWILTRSSKARSRPPSQIDVFKCPSCGASTAEMRDSVCAYCKTRVDTGAFDWTVTKIVLTAREPRGPQLTGTVPETGTDLPTITDPTLQADLQKLKARDPSFDPNGVGDRVKLIHREMNRAWSERDWQRARGFLSDELFQMQLYWIETYRRAGLRNVTENARVTRLVPCSVRSDRWYDALTLRLYATGLDYTVQDSEGRLVGGSKSQERRYSEYWTLIRSAGVKRAAGVQPNCPQCGAALKVTMAGQCEYCQSKITSGEFDWVLSRIEQDDSYSG
jgi:hypothetical protein